MAYKLSLYYSLMRVYMKLSFTISILVCKSLNGKTFQYSNNTFKKDKKALVLQS